MQGIEPRIVQSVTDYAIPTPSEPSETLSIGGQERKFYTMKGKNRVKSNTVFSETQKR
jgi:hypothetical protein